MTNKQKQCLLTYLGYDTGGAARSMSVVDRIVDALFPDPAPCSCGCRTIWTVFAGGGYDGLLPFWVRMQCPACGRKSHKKLFRTRAVRAWNAGRCL